MTRPHTTHHDDCGCQSAALKARVAELEAWVWEASDFLDELWRAFPTESATYFGASVLLNKYHALASAAAPQEPDAVAAAKERVVEAAKAVIGYPLMLRHTAFDWLKRELEALRAAEQAAGRREDV